MEKYSATCRLILCSTSTGRVLEPVRSRCLCLRVPAPSESELASLVMRVAQRESIAMSEVLAARIARESGRNARRALLCLEAARVRHGQALADDVTLPRPDWEDAVEACARMLLAAQTPAQLLRVRGRLYELLGHCLPPELLLRRLLEMLLPKVDASVQYELVEAASHYDDRLRHGSKPIFHLEAFCARFMSLYSQFLSQMNMFE